MSQCSGRRSFTATQSLVWWTSPAGYLAEACLVEKIPYTGFVQTNAGERVVRRYLFKRMRDLMCKPGSAHYDAALRNLLGADDAAAAAAAPPVASKATGGGAPASAAPAPDVPTPKQARAAGGGNPALLQVLKVLAQPARKATAGKATTREDGKSKAAKPKAKGGIPRRTTT